MIGYVYALVCPRTAEVVYVGSTKYSIEGRVEHHMAGRSCYPLYEYFYYEDTEPVIVELEAVEFKKLATLREREIVWIRRMAYKSSILFNVSHNPLLYRKRSGSDSKEEFDEWLIEAKEFVSKKKRMRPVNKSVVIKLLISKLQEDDPHSIY
jgi:hypothetical protein